MVHGNELTSVCQAIPLDVKAGNYLDNIRPVCGNHRAHWSRFPVCICLPIGSPEAWQQSFTTGIKKWNQYMPLSAVSPQEAADIEVLWVNHLPPKLFGITRLVIKQGHMHMQIFMLRPTFYLAEVPEKTLTAVFIHELGHALGLLGHSDLKSDVMYPIELAAWEKVPTRATVISARDLNTLKKVYEQLSFPDDYTMPAPMEWGSDDE